MQSSLFYRPPLTAQSRIFALTCFALSVAYAVCARRAEAADADAYVRLLWLRGTNAATCPEQAEVEQRVRERLGREPFAANAARTIEANVDSAGGVWHVELHVRDLAGAGQGQRVFDVRADSCAQVVDAVGLAVALAIDPNASFETPNPARVYSNQPSSDDNEAATSNFATGPSNRGSGPPRVAPIPASIRPVNSNCQAQPEYELTLRALAASGLLPGVDPGLAVAGAVGKRGIRLTLGMSYFPEKAQNSQFSFGLTTANAGLCNDLVKSNRINAALCGELQVGAVHTVVRELQPLHPGDRIYAALGIGPTLGWQAFAPFYVEGGVLALLALVRPQFGIKGIQSPVFESRPVSGVGFIGVGFMTR